MERYSLWDKYNEDKKKTDEAESSRYSLWEHYKKNKSYESTDTSFVDQKYIDSFINDYNAFLTTAEKEYGGLGWGTASSAYESRNTTWQELNERADIIGAWLYKNRNNLNQEAYSNFSASLEDIRRGGSSVLDTFKNAADYYAQWQSEEEYTNWYGDEWAYQKNFENIDATTASQGWQKYLADEEASKNALKYDLNNDGKESWWEKSIGYLGGNGGGVVDTELPNAGFTQTMHDLRADESHRRPKDDWSEEQRNAFGSLYATSPYLAYDFAEQTNKRNAKEKEDAALLNITNSATSGFWAGAGHTIGALATVQFGLADFLDDLALANAGRDIAPDGNISPFEYSQAVTGGIGEHLNNKYGTLDDGIPVIGGKGWGDAYGWASSTVQSIGSAYTLGSGGMLVSYFGQGAASAVDEKLSQGWSEEGSVVYGTAVGLIEGILEAIGGERLLNLGSATTAKSFIRQLADQAVAEGLEGGLASVGSKVAEDVIDRIYQSDSTTFDLLVKAYMANGMSKSDAIEKAWWDMVEEVTFDTISEGLSGGVGGAVQTGIQNIASNIGAKKTYGDGANLTKATLMQDPTNAFAQKMQAKVDSGKSLSGGQINRLVELNEQTRNSQNIADIASALQEKGMSAEEAMKTAEWLYKATEGETYNRRQRKAYETDDRIADVHRDLFTNEENSVNKRNADYDALYAFAKEVTKAKSDTKASTKNAPNQAGASAQEEEAVPVAENAPAKEPPAEGKFEASETGKTIYNGSEVKIQRIDSTKNREVMVQLDNGEVVSARDVEFSSQEEALIYEAVADMDVDTANDFIQGFNSMKNAPVANPQSFSDYKIGFNEAQTYGELGIPFEAMSRDGKYSKALVGNQAQIAYNRGRINGINKAASAKKVASSKATPEKYKDKGETHVSEINKKSQAYKSLNDTQKAGIAGMAAIYKALGIDVYFFESPVDSKGKRHGKNGYFVPEDNSVHLDLYAGSDGRGHIIFTSGHELTHYIRVNLPEKFKTFADLLFEQYEANGTSVATLIARKIDSLKKNRRITPDMTQEKVYDLAYEEVVADACEAMLGNGEAFAMLSEKVKAKDKGLWNAIKKFFTDLVARIKSAYENLSPDSVAGQKVAEMLETATDLQRMWVDMLVEASEVSEVSDIVTVDAKTESVAPMNSERTWTASEYVIHRDAMAEKIAKALGVSVKKAKSYIDDINSIAKMIADDRTRLDYEASSFGSAFVSNVEYGGSFDYTTLCKKRRIYTGTFTEIQKRLHDVELTPDDILKIRNLMIEEGIEATCGLCYVEGSRANMGKFAKEFIRLYKRDNPGAWIPNMADVNTPDGVEQMRINHPEAYDQYVYFWNHYGKLKDSDKALFASQQKPKLYEARKEYKGEILDHFKGDTTVAKKNLNGGIRMQSFSDFEIVHLIDTMQVIMDMSTVGLAGQAYTKVPEFAKAFGNTGLKINLSLIAKGVDADGKLIFDDREGMPHETAFDLRNQYSANVGTIIVTFTDEQLRAAMADPRIDFIIPFHRSQWKKGQYGAMGLPKGTKDYTYMQNEKLIKKTYHEYRGRMVPDKATNYMPNEYWDFSKSGKENAEAYLKMCAENNKRPKFYKLLDYDGKGTYSLKADGSTDGYWKLLIDFKMYDNNGVGSPQQAVTPTFNMDEAKSMLDEYKGGHSKYPVASSVVDTFVERYNKDNGTKYSDRDSYYMDAVNRGDMETAQKMVDEVAKTAGYTIKAYHGTNAEFTVFDKNRVGNGIDQYGAGFYFASNPDVTAGYGTKRYDTYLSIKKPIPLISRPGGDGRTLYDVRITQAQAYKILTQHPMMYDTENSPLGDFYDKYWEVGPKEWMVRDLAKQYNSIGALDGDVILYRDYPNELHEAIRDVLGYDGVQVYFDTDAMVDERNDYFYVAWFDNQIKSSDPVVRDDNGNVIPLSERFNAKNNDIRYSDRDSEAQEFSDADIKYSIREEAPPKKTKEGYKVFVVKNGKLYPPMVANPNAEDTPVGVWLNADVGTRAADSKTGRMQVKAGGKGTQGGSGSLAFRPGWHLGETPLATQFDRLNPKTGVKELFPENFVWALCDIAADHDYQDEAMSYGYTKNGKFQHSLAGLPKLPTDGYYKYRTNPNPDTVPWLITGAMKVKKLLSDAEVNAILAEKGLPPKQRVGGDKTLADLGLSEYDGKMYSDREFPSNAEDIAKEHFGTTNKWSETGWLLTDGTQLDFSGRHWETDPDSEIDLGESYYSGKRNVEHYEIAEAFPELGDFSHMEHRGENLDGFLSRGNIRIVGKGCIDLKVMPTDEQLKKLRGYFNESIDKHIVIGIGLDGLEFSKGTKASTIIEGIRDYFSKNRGQQSDLMRFHTMYSDRNPDSVSNRSLLAKALESAVKDGEERNKLRNYKTNLRLLEAEQAKLAEVKKQANDIRFTKGRTPEETKKMKALDFEANQIATRINKYDRELLKLEAMQPIKDILQRERQLAYKKAEKEGREALAKYREKAANTQRELLTRYQESRKKGIEGRKKTEMRHKIKTITSELDTLLRRPTSKKHIKEELRAEVADALLAINMDTVGADERVAKYDAMIAKANDPDVIEELTKTRDRIQLQGDNLKEKLANLRNTYEKIKASDDIELAMSYKEVIHNSIKNVSDKIGNTSIRNMTLEQLEMVYDLFSMIRKTVRDANKAFKEHKGQTIMQMAEAVNDQVRTVGGRPYKRNAVSAFLQREGWTLLKPYVAFRTIGSVTLTNLYKELRNGEDTFYGDVKEATTFIEEQYKKHNYNSWDMKQTKRFTAKSGKSFDLTLEQMMTLYAYSRREQAHKHIMEGGIVFEDAMVVEKNKWGVPIKYEVTTRDAFNLSEETFAEIANSLTAEQKAFVDAMQEYLSKTMGAKGNEVSMELLGVKLFKEDFYLPIKSSNYYMNFKPEEAGEIMLRSPAFSKETVQTANNPIVLHNFTDLWAEHINDMAMYHSFVLALEDFTRVYNYKTKTDSKVETMDTKATIETAYPGATKYINKFLRDLNGGVRGETVGWAEKLTSLAKKGAVLGSASVAIQQSSAVTRAMALVNPKYFVTTTHKSINLAKHKQDWEELKKYAPIAGIKEMGRFDVGMGKGTVELIKSNETFMGKVDDFLGMAPELMDEITWVSIWNAVKRETVHNYKNLSPASDEFLKTAGERFTEVISLTQVYDSVFSRSDLMRNKSLVAKWLTAFMAEPTTTLNMLIDAYIQGKRTGSKKGFVKVTAATTGAVVASIVFNAMLKSIIMAARDDDEDESYAEKYLEHFFGDLRDSLNPLTLVPVAKDVLSIFDGYDVERMDMSLVSDFKKAIEAFNSDNKTAYEKWSGLIGAISAMFGVPVKNVERDIRAVINTFFGKNESTTKQGLLDAISEGWTGESKANGKQLYEAMMSGDTEQIERVKGRYEDDAAIESAIRSALRENDPRIRKAAKALSDADYSSYSRYIDTIVAEGHFEEDTVSGAIRSELSAFNTKIDNAAEAKRKGKDEEYKKIVRELRDSYRGIYSQDDIVNLVKKAMDEQIAGNDDDDVEEATSRFKASDINAAFESGDTYMAQVIIDDLIQTKVANGTDEKKAKSSVKSSITSYWKPLYKEAYQSGDTYEMQRIRELLLASGLYGGAGDVNKTVRDWLDVD